jgi:hypothetical protein
LSVLVAGDTSLPAHLTRRLPNLAQEPAEQTGEGTRPPDRIRSKPPVLGVEDLTLRIDRAHHVLMVVFKLNVEVVGAFLFGQDFR